ncbi:MAG: polar amino acid transport system substrate-binding protein [Kiritimatiellia bacterium]|jgi:polar amino acid transport system substrate-binding protein
MVQGLYMKCKLTSLFLITFCTIHLAQAAEPVKLVTLEYPPYQYSDKGQTTGIVVDIVNEAFSRINLSTDISVNAWPRSLSMVKEGNADAIFTAYKNDERVKFLDYSKTVLMPQEVVLFVSPDSDIQFSGDIAQIKDLRIGIVRGISYGSVFDVAKKAGVFSNIEESTNIEQNAKKFASGRFDVLISNKYSALVLFKKLGMLDKVKKLDVPVQSVPSYIAFSKARGLSGLRDRLDTVLTKMIADGTYDKLVNKYSR